MRRGLLIVNADDWGAEETKTEIIRGAFAAGAVTSASGMVYMEDSERAAAIARREELAIGLHLNLTQPFSGRAVPSGVRARQEALLGHFHDMRRRRRTLDLRRRAAVAAAVSDQFARFQELYGHPPDHVDGHQHVHLCIDVLLVLPAGLKLRPPVGHLGDPRSDERFARLYRAARQALVRTRWRTPSRAFGLGQLLLTPGTAVLERALAFSAHAPIEIMCHPDRRADREMLGSQYWRRTLMGRPLGTYADL